MNNRFKFRYAYENKVYDAAKLDLLWEEVQVDTYDHVDTYSLVLAPGRLLQCTGLKDKNGTLIYEGDIIYVELEEDNALIKWNKQYARFDIHLIGQKVRIGFDGFDDFDDDCGDKLEVIGNIYENPELLKGQND